METDRELKEEVDRIITGLALSEEWDNRILAMGRLEGLVMGGAARLDSFCDVLKSLKDSLTAQVIVQNFYIEFSVFHPVLSLTLVYDFDILFMCPTRSGSMAIGRDQEMPSCAFMEKVTRRTCRTRSLYSVLLYAHWAPC